MILLVACSHDKRKGVQRAPAQNLYCGQLTLAALEYGRRMSIPTLILSAKYGFIPPEQVIETYDSKLEAQYEGPWPEGSGWYVGGPVYFGKAPDRFLPLVPPASNGKMVMAINILMHGGELKSYERGVVQAILEMLLESPHTKDQLWRNLCQEFGYSESYKKTIQAQVHHGRIDIQRDCTLHKEGDLFWLTKGYTVPKTRSIFT